MDFAPKRLVSSDQTVYVLCGPYGSTFDKFFKIHCNYSDTADFPVF